ncbi:MAG: thioredoxin [Haloferacaceae archaeon]
MSNAPEQNAAATPDEPLAIGGQHRLQTVVDDYDVVLVDFYADWCGPCQMLEPVIEDLAAETPAAVAKVDVDRQQSLAAEFGVQGVPTLLLFADGSPVERLVGVREKRHYAELVERYAE